MTAEDLLAGEIEADNFIVIKTGAGEMAERSQVDVSFLGGVMAGDAAGQHSRVGSHGFTADQGEARPGHRAHPERLEHGDMRMPAAYQDQIFDDGRFRPLHGCMIGRRRGGFKRYFAGRAGAPCIPRLLGERYPSKRDRAPKPEPQP